MSGTAFVFAGQGTQFAGMGRELFLRSEVARSLFAEADASLGMSLTDLMFNGPADRLALTEYAQPAILTVGVAAWRALVNACPIVPMVAAGHSLGEYGALVCADALDFTDAVRAVRARGRFMQEAAPVGRGAMAAVIGMEAGMLDRILQEVTTLAEPVTVAGYNSPEQITISGSSPGVERATTALKQAGVRRVLPLKVSAPFHSPLMQPVEEPMRRTLAELTLHPLRLPVVSNVDATPNQDVARVPNLLVRQLVAPVRWVESVRAMQNMGVTRFVEFGPGRTLAGMIKKIDPASETYSVEDADTLTAVAAALGSESV